MFTCLRVNDIIRAVLKIVYIRVGSGGFFLKKNEKSVLNDIINYVPSKVIPAIVGLLILAIFTRKLTPEQYGNYELVITTVNIFYSILISWIHQSSLRFYKKYELDNKINVFLSTSLLLILFLSL